MPPYTVLIVDGSPEERWMMASMLSREGEQPYELLEAGTGMDALAICRERPVDCILTDDLLPDLNGLALIQALAADEATRHIVVTIITSLGSPAVAVKSLKAGAHDYLVKSEVSGEELGRTVAEAIERAVGRRQAEVRRRQQATQEMAEQAMLRLGRLQALTASLAIAVSAAQVVQAILSEGAAALGAASCGVMLLSDDGMFLELAPGADLPTDEAPRQISLGLHTPLCDAVRNNTLVTIESPEELHRYYPALDLSLGARLGAAGAAIPIEVEARPIGGMAIGFAEPRSFSPEERAFLLMVGRLCGQSLERARLYQAEQHSRAEAEAAVRVRDQLISVAVHELKAPITVLLGSAQLLERRFQSESPGAVRSLTTLQMMVAQARRLDRMLDDLLDLSRLAHGQLQLQVEPLELWPVVERLVADIQPTLTRHTIITEQRNGPCRVLGDEIRLSQALQNLLSNAVKYSPQGGTVHVWTEIRAGRLLIAVQDQGIGIPHSDLPHLFKRFYRASNTGQWRISGTGIGLYVVAEVMQLHGGAVHVTSTEGLGSTFTLDLPLLEA